MRFRKTYLSREGRLPRGLFFLYLLLLGIISYILTILVQSIIVEGIILSIVILITNLIILYLYIPLIHKRQQDRGFNGKNKRNIIITIGIIFNIMGIFGYIMGDIMFNPNISIVVSVIAFVLSVIAIFEVRPLLFRRGTKGPNEYGPDPLEKK